jgi:hypothetical protein
MTDDLVKRLQDYLDCRPWAAGRTFDPTHPECLIAQAKDRIEQLEREKASWKGAYDGAVIAMTERIEALEAALRPFAELGEAWLPVDAADNSIFVTCPDSTPVNNITNFGFTFGSFRNAARAALGEKKDD